MRKRWEIIYTNRSAYDGMGTGEEPYETGRTQHRTWIGADFYRRFRFRPFTLGMRWVETAIYPVEPRREWQAHMIPFGGEPVSAEWLERWLWSPLYWLRNRWDGLRFGLDRDSRA